MVNEDELAYIRAGNSSVAFLSCCIPDLCFYSLSINHNAPVQQQNLIFEVLFLVFNFQKWVLFPQFMLLIFTHSCYTFAQSNQNLSKSNIISRVVSLQWPIDKGHFPHFLWLSVCVCVSVQWSVEMSGFRCHLGWWVGWVQSLPFRWGCYHSTERDNFGVDMGQPIVTNRKFVVLVCKNAWSNRAATGGGKWSRTKGCVRWEFRLPGQFWGFRCPMVTMWFSNVLLVWEKLIRLQFTEYIDEIFILQAFQRCTLLQDRR